jgi:2-polyprenyl-3-methyl-5-hydroxy-6-metoxy-1,4-benzoquinol methylase
MKEGDLRPAHLSEKQKKAYHLDILRYRKYLHEFRIRTCPGCGGSENSMYLEHDEFVFVSCVACHCIFMNPGPTDLHLADLYENSEIYKFWAEYMYPQSRDSRLATLHKMRVEWLVNAIGDYLVTKKNYRILEIGAGTGDTMFKLNSLNRSDLQAFAVEWNPEMKGALGENGVQFLGKTIADIKPNEPKFDVIVLFEVIEHLLDPFLLIQSAKKHLNENGLIMFTTPNAQSIEVQWMKARTMTIDIEHISLLSPAAVTHLASRNGMTVKKIETLGKLDREIMEKAGFGLHLTLDSIEIPQNEIQELIANGGFSSNMQVVLQNKHN